MSSSGRVLPRLEVAVVWLALVGVYLAVGGRHYSPGAGAAFVLVALAVSRRFDPSPLAAVPLLMVPAGVYSLASALLFAGLLLLGPLALHLLIRLVGSAVQILRTSEPGMERIAAIQVVAAPAWWCLIGGCSVLAVIEQGPLGLMVIAVPAALIWRRHFLTALAAALAGSALSGWSVAPLILAGVVATLLAWRLSARAPTLWHPFPRVRWRREPRTWFRIGRCDRRIRRGDLLRARSIVRSPIEPTDHDALRLAFLDIEERSYQRALSLTVESGELDWAVALLRARALSGIAQFDAAETIFERLITDHDRAELHSYLFVLRAENCLAAGDIAKARQLAEHAHARTEAEPAYFLRLRASCVLAECALEDENDAVGFDARIEAVDNDMLAGNRWVAGIALQADPARAVRQLFGRQGNVHLHFVRVEALTRRGKPDEHRGWDPEAVGLAMAISGWSDHLVELLLAEAGIAGEAGRDSERLRLGTRALMELDATRYRLAAQSARTSWSRRLQRALGVTLDAAFREEEHALVAELLEFARVQALPAATAEASGDFALSTPPVVQLRGLSRLARPGEINRPAPAALEAAAVRAAGPDGWWLSFWEVDGWLYSAVVPPDSGEIASYRKRIDRDSDLGRTLADLEMALPLQRPEEDAASADFRVDRSPLLRDPEAERALSARLGSLLVPDVVTRAARVWDDRGQRLSLAIVPSPSLGYVPWGLLAMARSDEGYDRLLELCDWVIAPSAALLVGAPPGSDTEPAPLALAVADTTATNELGPLEGARQQANALSSTVTVLGGRHWAPRKATVEAVKREFAAAGPAITAAFMCHAVRGTSDEPSRGGIVMAADDDLEVLSPVDIFEMSGRGIGMPAQVLLQACDTSALSDSASGEWLTLAPALIAGGSREIVATLYPVPDLYVPDDPLIAAAVAGTSLREAVVLSQRIALARWEAEKASEPSHTPLAWAAYAPICVKPSSGPGSGDGSQVQVSARFVQVVADAIRECREGRAERLESGYLLSALLQDSEIALLFDGGGHSLKPSTFVWTLGPYVCSRFLRMRDGDTRELRLNDATRIEVSETMVGALNAARSMAARDGVLIEPEHLLAATLGCRSGARQIARFLSALSRRPFELTVRAIAHNLADVIARGQRPAAVESGPASEQERLARQFAEIEERYIDKATSTLLSA